MQRIAGGDQGAYRAFSERHLSAILRYAARLLGDASEAEDVVQDTFLRVWQQANRYQARGVKPGTWLYRIAHNLCIDRLRRRRPGDAAALDRHSSGDRPSTLLDRKQLAGAVQSALAALPERQRAALCLVHYEGLTNLEAAAVLDCKVHAVESLLVRARRNLRTELAQLYAQVKGELP
jgi:RNA polymerase sigma-70 factor (ECF subfamily)